MKLIASVRDKETKELKILRMDYPTKKEFKKEVRANGYSLNYNYIFTESEYEDFLNDGEMATKIQLKLERKKIMNKIRRESHKRFQD